MDQFSYWKRACTIILLCAGAISSPAQTFTTLVNFIGTNGGYPSHGSLVQSSDGNFYGTTQVGGPMASVRSSK